MTKIAGTKFYLKLKIFAFGSEFAQKSVFFSKTEKVNTIMKFSIIGLV